MRFDPATHTVHAAGRTWQADPAETTIETTHFADFPNWGGDPDYVYRRRRCMVRFESGWSASIVWGNGTYSSNHDADSIGIRHLSAQPFTEEPTTVEVGVIDHTDELRQRRHIDDDGTEWSDVETYVTDDELAILLDHLAGLPTDADYGDPPPDIAEITSTFRSFLEERGLKDETP